MDIFKSAFLKTNKIGNIVFQGVIEGAGQGIMQVIITVISMDKIVFDDTHRLIMDIEQDLSQQKLEGKKTYLEKSNTKSTKRQLPLEKPN